MKYFLYLFILNFSQFTFAQSPAKILGQYTHFQITHKKDTIDFLVADTNLAVQKPILLYCQGSQPVPLFFDYPNYGVVPIAFSNFDLEEMKKAYHVVVISMPKTPVIVGFDHLDKSYCYVEHTAVNYSYSKAYVNADFLENYVDRGSAVLRYLSKQRWVNSNELVLVGQSQGSKVALGIAAAYKKVTKVGLFGYNPLGRIDQMVRQARKDAEHGKISWEEADSLQYHYYDYYKEINNEDSLKMSASLRSWKSFSTSSIDKLLSLKIPIYIGYGSEDVVADFCDILPLLFIEKHKSNLTLKRYSNLEHNYFPIINGIPDHQNGQWKTVMNAFIEWSLK